jgi:hypothetical protein
VTFFIGLLVTVVLWLFPDAGKQIVARVSSPGQEQALAGTWQGVTNYSSPQGNVIASGFTRLKAGGEYSYSGQVEIRTSEGAMQFNALAVGTWKATDEGFMITATDMKTVPQLLRQTGKPDLDLTKLEFPGAARLLPRLEDITPQGTSQEYAIVEITPKRLLARGSDIRGNPVTYEATRQLAH